MDRIGIRPERREDHGFAIPVAPLARRLARGRVLLTGDAAGLVDPLTCEGISNAIASAGMAAAAIVANPGRPELVRQAYERSLRREILPELRLARALARLLYGFPRLRQAAFRRAGDALCHVMAQASAGDSTYRGLLGRPANYLRFVRRLAAWR